MRTDDTTAVRATVPADVDAPDKILYGLTFRQLAILAVAAVIYYSAFRAGQQYVPMPVLIGVGVVWGGLAFGLAVGRRDGQSLDAWLLAALRYRRAPKALASVPATPGALPGWAPATSGAPVTPAPLRLPAHAIDPAGQLQLDSTTAAVVATTTVNLALRTGTEQAALVDGFGRWLNSLTTPTQIVVATQPVDLAARIARLRAAAGRQPHPALAAACADHAAFLAELGVQRDPLRRQVLVVTTTAAGETGEHAASRHADDTARALAALGVTAQPLTGPAVAAALAAAVDPFRPAVSGARPTDDTPITRQ
jgi:hypothetical protein